MRIALLLLFAVSAARAADLSPVAVTAFLVEDESAENVDRGVVSALAHADPLVRATAARVAFVRIATATLPALHEVVKNESNPIALREELRALTVLGDAADVDLAIASANASNPPLLSDVALAVARRPDAVDLYLSKLSAAGYAVDKDFFTLALWHRTLAVTASRVLGVKDDRAWRALLAVASTPGVELPPSIAGASLNVPSEDIRNATVWWLARTHAADPQKIDEYVRTQLALPVDASLREAYGRELLNRMLGAAPKTDPRWIQWLQTFEADQLLGVETPLFEYFTEEEFVTRKKYCDLSVADCTLKNYVRGRKMTGMAPKPVPEPAYAFPTTMPPGMVKEMFRAARCDSRFIAVAGATADLAGRIRNFAMRPVTLKPDCVKPVNALTRLSVITPQSITTPVVANNVVLVHEGRTEFCLDEDPPGIVARNPARFGGRVKAPVVRNRVEPMFPVDARRRRASALVIAEGVISRTGCMRNVRLVGQSEFGSINSAALLAISQWTFYPGLVDGEPADVIFNLTMSFNAR